MRTVGLRDLRQQASELVRLAEQGEDIIVTVSGRPAAKLTPAMPKAWRTYDEVADLFPGQRDADWEHDRDLIDGTLVDPWERR